MFRCHHGNVSQAHYWTKCILRKKNKVVNLLKHCNVTLAIDGWTNEKNKSIIGVTI